MGWAPQIHGVRHSLQTGRLHPKKTHAVGHKLAQGCISSAQRRRGVTAGQREAKVHLQSLLWGIVGKYPAGYPEETHCCPTSACQNKPLSAQLSGLPCILKTSKESILQKQTIICKISWYRSFPLCARFLLSCCHLTTERQVMEDSSEEVEEAGRVWQVSIGLTSSFFPFPSLPPLSLCLTLFILHVFPSLSISSGCCSNSRSTTRARIADCRDKDT